MPVPCMIERGISRRRNQPEDEVTMSMRCGPLMAGVFTLAGAVSLAALPAVAAYPTQQPGQTYTVPHRDMSSHKIALVQESLDSTGAHIAIDGVWGPNTERALRNYQRSEGLNVTGRLDHATMQSLDPIG